MNSLFPFIVILFFVVLAFVGLRELVKEVTVAYKRKLG